MGTLLQLRRGALAAGTNGREQLALLEDSASTVMVVFRALLRLSGEKPGAEHARVIDQVAALTAMDAGPFHAVIRHKRGDAPLRGADAGAVLAGYLEGMQRVVKHLDRLHAAG
jgi:hypothetical protein